MLILSSEVKVNGNPVQSIKSVSIQHSQKQLYATAEIQFPPYKSLTEESFKVGQPVEIYLWYASTDKPSVPDFKGYIEKISPNTPLTLTCMDEFYKIKDKSLTKKYSAKGEDDEEKITHKSTILKGLISGLVSDQASEVKENDKLEFTDKPYTEVIEQLKKECKRNFFYIDETPYFVKHHYVLDDSTKEELDFNKHVISSELDYKMPTAGSVKVISMANDSKTVMVKAGDQEPLVVIKKNNLTEAGATQLAEDTLEERTYEGFTGKLITFGYPKINVCTPVKLIDKHVPERNGTFVVIANKTTYGSGGFRQELELGRKLNT